MTLPSQALPLATVFYDKNSGGYWFQDAKGAWLRLKDGDFVDRVAKVEERVARLMARDCGGFKAWAQLAKVRAGRWLPTISISRRSLGFRIIWILGWLLLMNSLRMCSGH